MTKKERDLLVYQSAVSYLETIIPDGMAKADLDKYYVGDSRNFNSLIDIYKQFISSAQNYQGMPNYIKFSERSDDIKTILLGYDIEKIARMSVDDLYKAFRVMFNVTSKDSKYNAWHKWSRSVIDSAKFMQDFENVDDFRQFVGQFDYNLPTRTALPLLISTKISGMGFSLACDTLKELGFINYAKPDTHLIDICKKLSLSNEEPISVFEAIVRMASDCVCIDPNVTPYKVDKILWLISSGKFYLDEKTVGSHKDEFLKKTKALLLDKFGG